MRSVFFQTFAATLLGLSLPASNGADAPLEWMEPATGHRVVRLSREPGSASLYFPPLPERRRLDPPGNGQWIYLFRPRPGEFEPLKVGNETVKVGKFDVEKLVDLSKHNYRLEPNVTFTPDDLVGTIAAALV